MNPYFVLVVLGPRFGAGPRQAIKIIIGGSTVFDLAKQVYIVLFGGQKCIIRIEIQPAWEGKVSSEKVKTSMRASAIRKNHGLFIISSKSHERLVSTI